MITKYYSEIYQTLFKKAEERLKELNVHEEGSEEDIKIETLEEYFSHLYDLIYGNGGLNQQDIEAGYLFLRLPLDEPTFQIDANSRIITIPQTFAKNGLSVHGDEVAEIVFFEIDRFYDATDLALQSISIQWEDAQGNNDHIAAFIRDISEEGKLVFGWPITSAVTRVPGKLRFSVRFYTENDSGEGYSYLLSTLPATIMINEGLKLDTLQVEADDAKSLILNRIQNSPHGEIRSATAPYFVRYGTDGNLINISDSANTIDQVPEDGVTLAALAAKKDSGTIYYKWYHNGTALNDEWATAVAIGRGDYILTDSFIDGIATYFYENGDKYSPIVVSKEDFDSKKQLHGGKLYVNCSTYTLIFDGNDITGQYSVKAENRLYGSSEGLSEDATIPTWIVLGPETPVFTTDLKSQEILSSTNNQLEVELNNVNDNSTEYAWSYAGTDKIFESLDYVEGKRCPITKEGYYKVTVTNRKNGGETSVDSTTCLVITEIPDRTISIEKISGTNLYAKIDGPAISDFESIKYSWTIVEEGSPVLSTGSICTITKNGVYKVSCTVTKGTLEKSYADGLFNVTD